MQSAFRRSLRIVLSVFLLMGLLQGCGFGGNRAETPTETTEAAAAAPTRTPRPTREATQTPAEEPTATLAPTAEPTQTEEATATADEGASSGGLLQQVVVGDLETYSYSTGLFQLDVPNNWDLTDNSTDGEAILVWTDPSENGAIIVDIFQDDSTYTNDDLVNILTTFLKTSFGTEPDFVLDDPAPQEDGSILVVWSYTATADNNVKAPLLGNSFIEQRDDKVSLLTTLVPQEQFESLQDTTNTIINSYKIDSAQGIVAASGNAGEGTATDEPTEGEVPATLVAIGEPVTVGNLVMTVNSVTEPEGTDFAKPDAGNKFVLVDVSFQNTSTEQEVVSTLLQMTLLDAKNNSYDLNILAAVLADTTADGEIAAGETLTGGAGFEVPQDATGLIFVFNPLIEGDPVGVRLEE